MRVSKHVCLIFVLLASCHVYSQSMKHKKRRDRSPVIPIGLDSYRMWDKLYLQRPGVRAYMRSTYDREGGNQSADASHYLFANGEDHNVSLDVKGKGVLYFFRANHWHGSPWHFIVDGKDNVVEETGTSDPVNAKRVFAKTTFIPAPPFPEPLAWTWSTTKGADLIWTPMPFGKSFRIAYSHTRYGTGYYIYHLYANEENLSQPIRSWDIGKAPDQDVVALVSRAGTDIAPQNISRKNGKLKLRSGKLLLANVKASPSVIRAFKVTLPLEKAIDLERLRLLITWDDAKYASVDAPLCLFFGAGTLYNRENDEYLVKGFPMNIRYDYVAKKVELACYYPMPFFKSARFEIVGTDVDNTEIEYEIRYEPLTLSADQSSYFHATYKDISEPELGKDMIYLDTRGMEGVDEWSGSFVGTSFIFSHDAVLRTLEGDPRFFFDDSRTPQAYGTGTEEWAGGGDYWGGANMTLPFAGHPCGAPGKSEAKNEKDLIESAYRFLIADMMPFGKRAIIGFEHGGENLSREHYEAVTYWYGLPAPSLIKTDEIDIGKPESERRHAYNSPDASVVVAITSRYELGIDRFPSVAWGMDKSKIPGYTEKIGKEIYPGHQEDGRYTRGVSEFNVELDPDNVGVLLRRTLDYSFPNQTAEVYVAARPAEQGLNDHGSSDIVKWEFAGTWYLAGANTAIYSDPPGELDNRLLRTKTTNRRFRDDEFLIPAKLTANQSTIKIRIRFIPNDQLLFPDFPFPKKSAWSELRYEVFSYIRPEFSVPK